VIYFLKPKRFMDDIVIVGGGIIGASAAYFLSKEGRIVRVLSVIQLTKRLLFLCL